MSLIHQLVRATSFDQFIESSTISSLSDPQFGDFVKQDLQVYYDHFKNWVPDPTTPVISINKISNEAREVEELELTVKNEAKEYVLPICTVSEKQNDGMAIRLYYSNYPITNGHKVRPRILTKDDSLKLPKPVEIYQNLLAAGDLDTILEIFANDATVREPSGGESIGKESLKNFYSFLFSCGGGAPLEHCTETTNDRSCSIEYNIVKVGTHTITPQAGIAVYDWENDQLTAARIYDDFEPPA